MTVHLPRMPYGLAPLLREAKRRMRRRRLILTAMLAGTAILAVALTVGLQPTGKGTPRSGAGITSAQSALPKDRLIVFDRSIGPVRLGERRESVERTLGRGIERPKGDRAVAYYFGGRLRVTYGDHGMLRPYVVTVSTNWKGFHTASGLRVGAPTASLSHDSWFHCMTGLQYCLSRWAWRQMYVLHHAEPSPLTAVSFRHGVVTSIGLW